MSVTKREQEMIDLVEPLCEAHGFELVDLEVVGGSKSPTIRVYVDVDGGITFDELAAANSWIGDAVEEADPFPGAYVLEVSSPGIDRPLRKRSDFERFAGEEVSVKLEKGAAADNGAKGTVAGILTGIEGDDVLVDCVDGTVRLDFGSIRKARIKGRIDFSRKDF